MKREVDGLWISFGGSIPALLVDWLWSLRVREESVLDFWLKYIEDNGFIH